MSRAGQQLRRAARAIVLLLALFPAAAYAQKDDDKVIVDARLEGFIDQGGRPTDVTVENASVALAWVLLLGLTVVAMAPMFKDARRTHLD